jgi:AAA+ ATPase superfamily predicted ATPase
MDRFIGRKGELKALEDPYNSAGSAFVPIYGRRRVGKSELIRKFMSNKTGIYYVGKHAPARLQLAEFMQEAAGVLEVPLLATVPADNWKQALSTVVEQWDRQQKLVIALDEFQWMASASPELPSVLQELWDRDWQHNGSIFLILCGSYVGFMERKILGRKSPLFGRRTAQILLKPFSFLEAAGFHPGYSLAELAKTYYICGGVPLYLNSFKNDRSVETNVERAILDDYAPLRREPDFLLREELRGLETYNAILFAIAGGSLPTKEIVRLTGIDSRAVGYYLKQLMELGYLARRYPLTGKKPSARHVRYTIEDNLMRFWFTFIYPNESFLSRSGPRSALRERIKPNLAAYFGLCFERMCREALPYLYEREGIAAGFVVGEYWDKNTQIDVVGRRDDDWIDLGECKWGPVRSAAKLEKELARKVELYPRVGDVTIHRRIFTRKPIKSTHRSAVVSWHSLEDLYSGGLHHNKKTP